MILYACGFCLHLIVAAWLCLPLTVFLFWGCFIDFTFGLLFWVSFLGPHGAPKVIIFCASEEARRRRGRPKAPDAGPDGVWDGWGDRFRADFGGSRKQYYLYNIHVRSCLLLRRAWPSGPQDIAGRARALLRIGVVAPARARGASPPRFRGREHGSVRALPVAQLSVD